jgi:23S rRNA pseudouridine955/2504/2580 synthase
MKPTDDASTEIDPYLHPKVRRVFFDGSLLVLDKPAGVLSHPNPPGREAANALLRAPYDSERELYRLERAGERQRQVHLVHRLDQYTSGLILCTLRAESAATLKEALFHHEIEKEYRAMLLGVPRPPEGEWSDRLSKGTERGRLSVRATRGAPNAVTRYRVLEILGKEWFSLVSFWPETGRTHQLRVQTATRRVPIAGDERYGDFAANRFLASKIGLRHMFLHAHRLELRHPERGHLLRFQSPLPRRLAEPLERARVLQERVPRR